MEPLIKRHTTQFIINAWNVYKVNSRSETSHTKQFSTKDVREQKAKALCVALSKHEILFILYEFVTLLEFAKNFSLYFNGMTMRCGKFDGKNCIAKNLFA